MIIQELKERKRKMGMTNSELAERSGVPLSTVAKVLGGTTLRPRIDTIRALEAALRAEDDQDVSLLIRQEGAVMESGDSYIYGSNARKENNSRFHSPEEGNAGKDKDHLQNTELYGHEIRMDDESYTVEAAEKKSGGSGMPLHTVEDYLALPDERRVEMIDGRFYDLAAPGYVHQEIAGRIYRTIGNYIDQKGGNCNPGIAPLDVQLDKDDKTMVQPDVIIDCREGKKNPMRIIGAPDFVLEVLSDSSRSKDVIIKTEKYMSAGCREYWIVDPRNETVIVYDFENERYPLNYTFEDKVPVNIYDGDLTIDFSVIRDKLKEMFGNEMTE